MNLRSAIVRLREFGQRIRQPHDFYASHAPLWLEMTVRITKATVMALRPHDEIPAVWAQRAETLASRIGYQLHTMPAAGITIYLSDSEPGANPDAPGSPAHQASGVSIADLIRFIQEGERGNPLGKNLDERDDPALAKGHYAAIAWRMMYAIKRGAHGTDGLLRQLNRFLGGANAQGGDGDRMADAILKAWLSTLVPVVHEDWAGWLARRARSI